MKFQKPENFRKWTIDETDDQIRRVQFDVAEFNRDMNNINSKINTLNEQKRVIKNKISNKNKYINQLIKQIKVQLQESEWKEL